MNVKCEFHSEFIINLVKILLFLQVYGILLIYKNIPKLHYSCTYPT